MSVVIVVGAQWGDEGKGKVVDLYTERADTIVRYGGGANAGHTLVINGQKLVTRLVPSADISPTAAAAILKQLGEIAEGLVFCVHDRKLKLRRARQLFVEVNPTRRAYGAWRADAFQQSHGDIAALGFEEQLVRRLFDIAQQVRTRRPGLRASCP